MSKQGAWKDMAAQVSDEVLDLFVARAPYEGIAEAIERRFGGIVDTVSIDFVPGTSAATRRKVVEAIQRIPHRFTSRLAGSRRGSRHLIGGMTLSARSRPQCCFIR